MRVCFNKIKKNRERKKEECDFIVVSQQKGKETVLTLKLLYSCPFTSILHMVYRKDLSSASFTIKTFCTLFFSSSYVLLSFLLALFSIHLFRFFGTEKKSQRVSCVFCIKCAMILRPFPQFKQFKMFAYFFFSSSLAFFHNGHIFPLLTLTLFSILVCGNLAICYTKPM